MRNTVKLHTSAEKCNSTPGPSQQMKRPLPPMRSLVLATLAASILAGCMGTSPQLARYQADRDKMMFTNNPSKD